MTKKQYDSLLLFLQKKRCINAPIQLFNEWSLTEKLEFNDVSHALNLIHKFCEHPNIIGGENESAIINRLESNNELLPFRRCK